MLPPWPEPDAQTLKLLSELAAAYRLLTDAAIATDAPSPADARFQAGQSERIAPPVTMPA